MRQCVCVCFPGRWVKFEEKVEEGGERWSKPHVSTLSLHSLFELRTCLQTGTVLLDLEGYSLPQIIAADEFIILTSASDPYLPLDCRACSLIEQWVKFEEKVEEGGERWSKPHVSTLSLHSLFELRTCLQTGTVLLDLEGYSLPQIIDDIIEKQVEDGLIKAELRDKISFVLLRKHRHQTKKPIHRSLADMGKSVSSPSNRSPSRSPSAGANLHRSSEDLRTRQAGSYGRLRKSAPNLSPFRAAASEEL
ncbi:UNVERIFIED_CONTAM: hypothetical protein FKN15_071612 [Acipenser sinensis]